MNKKLCILLVLAVLCSAVYAGKDSKEKSKEKSKESQESKSKESEEKSNESSSKEVTETPDSTTIAPAAEDRCVGQPDGTVLPSLTTCSNFVTCQGEVETPERPCVPSGTIFDSSRGVCDYEPNVVCTIEEGETEAPTTEAATTAPEPSPEQLKGLCKGVIIDMIPHPGNCGKFVICVLGKPSIQSCGKNQVFYSDIKVCAFGDPKKC
ncbi:peritrophin-1-like [Anopheles albimanus]|uniref:Chitin-binding type-2 domain-containing protein n=1 Tax=Anopheles albimanus TaxID=7167 RepID=A0A182FBV1_ANOAL|nr:peritrophin-1-like [Anopheles albimanus]